MTHESMTNNPFYILAEIEYKQKEYIDMLQEKIDKLRSETKCAWWERPPEDRMRIAIESIAEMAIHNATLDNDSVLNICRIALTGVNTKNNV